MTVVYDSFNALKWWLFCQNSIKIKRSCSNYKKQQSIIELWKRFSEITEKWQPPYVNVLLSRPTFRRATVFPFWGKAQSCNLAFHLKISISLTPRPVKTARESSQSTKWWINQNGCSSSVLTKNERTDKRRRSFNQNKANLTTALHRYNHDVIIIASPRTSVKLRLNVSTWISEHTVPRPQ